jgi:uncharacterized protein
MSVRRRRRPERRRDYDGVVVTEKQQNQDAAADGASRHMFGHGRLSYVQIPALDVRASAQFYERVFAWRSRGGGSSHLSFTDSTGDMIGAWVTGRAVSPEPGVLPYIYVHGIDAVLENVVASGGAMVKPPYPEGDLWVATFSDPAGNVIGVWQQAPR